MKRISLKLGLVLGTLALAACANDKPATDASGTTTTTSARAPDGLMSSNPNDTNATGAATNESPNAPSYSPPTNGTTTSTSSGTTTTTASSKSATGATTDTSVPQTRTHTNDAHGQTWGNGSAPQAGTDGNAAGASQPPATTAPPPPNAQNSGSGGALTPMDQGNNASDLKVTQQIRKQVVSDSSLSFTAKNVKIITVNGKVTLKGQVNTDNEKKSIEATADKVVGNANVDNQITVKQ